MLIFSSGRDEGVWRFGGPDPSFLSEDLPGLPQCRCSMFFSQVRLMDVSNDTGNTFSYDFRAPHIRCERNEESLLGGKRSRDFVRRLRIFQYFPMVDYQYTVSQFISTLGDLFTLSTTWPDT